MAKKKAFWSDGDYFAIPLEDGSVSLGQVISYEGSALASALCVFLDIRAESASELKKISPSRQDLVSVCFTTRDTLDSGLWAVIGRGEPMDVSMYYNLPELRAKGFLGLRVTGSGNLAHLMNAYYGLAVWNDFYYPEFLNDLLVPGRIKPSAVVYK